MPITFGGGINLGSATAEAQFHGDAVADAAALTAILPEDRFDRQERNVESPYNQYIFDLQSAAAASGIDVLVPDDSPATGRWFRLIPSGGVPAGHAASHAENASDEILAEDLGTADTDTSKALMPDGLGGVLFGAVAGGAIAVLTGSQDLTAGTPVDLNIVSATGIRRITRARFWITVNGADVGANTATKIQLKFFGTDGFLHAELDSPFAEGLVEDFGEFQFVSNDLSAAPNNGDGTITIDATGNFKLDSLIRILDGTNFEYQRVKAVTPTTVLTLYDTILKAGTPAWAINDDVSRVFELRDMGCVDQDGTDEIHLRMIPLAGDDNCRLHFVIEFEGGA